MTSLERIEDACVRLSRGGVVLGEHLAAGPYTPPVVAEHLFAVYGPRGEPLVLAHDAFEAALALVHADASDPDEDRPPCHVQDSDAARAASLEQDRFAEYGWRMAYYNLTLDDGRSASRSRGGSCWTRWPRKQGRDDREVARRGTDHDQLGRRRGGDGREAAPDER